MIGGDSSRNGATTNTVILEEPRLRDEVGHTSWVLTATNSQSGVIGYHAPVSRWRDCGSSPQIVIGALFIVMVDAAMLRCRRVCFCVEVVR